MHPVATRMATGMTSGVTARMTSGVASRMTTGMTACMTSGVTAANLCHNSIPLSFPGSGLAVGRIRSIRPRRF